MRNLQEQVKKAFCYQQLFWPLIVWINCSCDLKFFSNSWLSASNFKSLSRSLEHFFLTVDQNNFGNKIPLFYCNDLLHCIFAKSDQVKGFCPLWTNAMWFLKILLDWKSVLQEGQFHFLSFSVVGFNTTFGSLTFP